MLDCKYSCFSCVSLSQNGSKSWNVPSKIKYLQCRWRVLSCCCSYVYSQNHNLGLVRPVKIQLFVTVSPWVFLFPCWQSNFIQVLTMAPLLYWGKMSVSFQFLFCFICRCLMLWHSRLIQFSTVWKHLFNSLCFALGVKSVVQIKFFSVSVFLNLKLHSGKIVHPGSKEY